MSIHENIAYYLSAYMREKNLSIEACAEELGIARSSLQTYLAGEGNMRIDTLKLLANKLNISPAQLISNWSIEQTVQTHLKSLHPDVQEIAHDVIKNAEYVQKLSDDIYVLEKEKGLS